MDLPGSLRTIETCARAVSELAESRLRAFLEPLPVVRDGGAYKVQRTVAAAVLAIEAERGKDPELV